MRAATHDAPLVEHNDLVGMKYRGNALGHDDLSFAAKLLGERMAQRGVGFVVERAEASSNKNARAIGGKRAGDSPSAGAGHPKRSCRLGKFRF